MWAGRRGRRGEGGRSARGARHGRPALEGELNVLEGELDGLGWWRSVLLDELEGSGCGIPASPAALMATRRG